MMERTNWFEKPTTVRMTNKEIEDVVRTQSRYFDVFPSAWYTDWSKPLVTEVIIHDDEGVVYLKAKKQSKNSWRVQTTF